MKWKVFENMIDCIQVKYNTTALSPFCSLCVGHCSVGYYTDIVSNMRTCVRCDRSCASCSDEGSTSCTSCASGYYLDTRLNSCVTECPNEYFPGKKIQLNFKKKLHYCIFTHVLWTRTKRIPWSKQLFCGQISLTTHPHLTWFTCKVQINPFYISFGVHEEIIKY